MSIVPRRLDFTFDPETVPAAWYAGDLHLTTFWTALSLLFPEGERFFVESVRGYKDRLGSDAGLAGLVEDVDAFVAQEAMHGKGHRAFNDLVHRRGMASAAPIERQLRRLLVLARRTLGPRGRLAVTCALEHFTAIMAEQLLGDASHREANHPSVRALWTWHALEEAEHRAVAFDVYAAVGGTYPVRAALMLVTSAIFFAELFWAHARLLRDQGELWDGAGWARAVDYLWLRPGLFRKLAPAWLDYLRPGFHPAQRDTGALLDEARAALFGPSGVLRDALRAA